MEALQGIYKVFDSNIDVFKSAFGDVKFYRRPGNRGGNTSPFNSITIFDANASWDEALRYTIVHEMGHVFDHPDGLWLIFQGLKSAEFVGPVWPSNCLLIFSKCYALWGASGNPPSEYAKSNSSEDYAEAFAVYVSIQNEWDIASLGRNSGDQTRTDIIKKHIALTVQNVPKK